MFFSGAIVATIGILQYLVGLDILPQEYPPAATFANRNVTSEFIVICLPLGFGIFFTEKGKLSLLYVSLGIETMLLFLFYSFTRSCILAVGIVSLIAFSVILILCIRDRVHIRIGKKHLTALCALVIVFIFWGCLTPQGFDTSKFGKISDASTDAAEKFKSAAAKVSEGKEFEKSSKNIESESVYFRLAAWRNALVMVGDKPILGVGLGNLKIHYPRYHRIAVYDGMSGERKQLLNLHNDYLQVLVELGAIGFLLLTVLICALAVIAWKAMHSPEKSSAIMPAALTASLFCYGIVSFFGFPASRAVHPAYIALIVAGLLTCSGNARVFFYKSSPAWLPSILKSASILIVIVAVFCGFHRLEADKYFLLMAKAADESNFEEVVLYGNKVLDYDPSRRIVYSYLGRAFNSLKQPEKGIECLKKVLKYNPWHITAMINLGAAYSELGDYKNASEIFSRGLSIAPESAALHNNFGNLLSKTGKNSEALAEFALAVKHEPDNPIYVYNKGYVELVLGRKNEALESFKTALKLKPSWELPQKQIKALSVPSVPRTNPSLK
jgi:tetratricopeptide (TPR) repeat protein